MAEGVNLTSKKWLDIIFDGKNKEYGAYELRKKSSRRHVLAIIFTIVLLVAVALGVIVYNIYSEYQREKEEALALAQAEKMSQIDLAEAEEEEVEDEPEDTKYEEPKVEVPEEVLATVQVTQIAIVDADKVKNEVMTMDEQKEDNTARGSVTQEGKDDITAFRAVEEKVVVKEPEPEPVVQKKPEAEQIFKAVEQPASFPGGAGAMMKWLSNNVRYPDVAQQNNIEGKVIVQFVVEKDGSIGQPTVVKGVDKDLDREALRVVKKMPKWSPGKNNGQAVRSYFTLPVTFKLQQM